MSVEERIVIADFTGGAARVGVTAPGSASVAMPDETLLPLRVVLRREESGVVALTGSAAASASADARTLVFNHLNRLLPRVADAELRSRLCRSLWRAFCESLEVRGLVAPLDSYVGYVIHHHLTPQPLLEDFRAACADALVPVAGFLHEGLALALGFVRSPLHARVVPGDAEGATVCLAVAHDEADVEVACFDISAAAVPRRELVMRDFFHTTCADLSRALESRQWSDAVTHLVSVEEVGLSSAALESFLAALQEDYGGASKKRLQTAGTRRLKIKGAAYVAQCRHGHGDEEEYLISGSYGVGVQVDRKRFHAVIEGQQLATGSFPLSATQTFALSGRSEGELRINLCCGYSDRVGEAVSLGTMSVNAGNLARGAEGGRALTVSVTFDAPGAGQFLLETPGGGSPLGHHPFVLPGLVV